MRCSDRATERESCARSTTYPGNAACSVVGLMRTDVAFEGIEPSTELEAAVVRWAARLESVWPVEHCEVRLRVRSLLWGLIKRARVEVTVDDALHVAREATFHHQHDLYPLVSDGFRDARRQLVGALAR